MVLLVSTTLQLQSQPKINGHFPVYAGKIVSLSGYLGTAQKQFATTTVDCNGDFSFKYPDNYIGVGLLRFNNSKGLAVILNQKKNFTVKGSYVFDVDSLSCYNNSETNTLYTYYKEQNSREEALSVWCYLRKVYGREEYLHKYEKANLFQSEIDELQKGVSDFIDSQTEGSYLQWYLSMVAFIRDLSLSQSHFPERISDHINSFMTIDFSDIRFYNSGLLPTLFDKYFFMLENMGCSADSTNKEINIASDYVLSILADKRPEWLQPTGLYLFKLFKRRKLTSAARHLSHSMLNQNTCVLTPSIRTCFEDYLSEKKGQNRAVIEFVRARPKQQEKEDNNANN